MSISLRTSSSIKAAKVGLKIRIQDWDEELELAGEELAAVKCRQLNAEYQKQREERSREWWEKYSRS